MISQAQIGKNERQPVHVVMLNSVKNFKPVISPTTLSWFYYPGHSREKLSNLNILWFTLRGSESTDTLGNIYYNNTFTSQLNW